MNRKIILLTVFLVSAAMALSGCAELGNKFIRKKKKQDGVKRYYAVHKYDVHPSLELYEKRYIFWKNWQRSLLEDIDDPNHKKPVVDIEQAISNLMDMYGMLIDEKGDELMVYINEMLEYEETIKKQSITGANRVKLRRRIENTGKGIKLHFSYRKVGGYIRSDFRE